MDDYDLIALFEQAWNPELTLDERKELFRIIRRNFKRKKVTNVGTG